jgi:hypothetical protein
MKKLINEDSETAAMDMVKLKSERCVNEALAVLDGLKEGTIPIADATEMSNAIGKANAALGNIIKADFLCLAIDKRASNFLEGKRGKRIGIEH